ncbi:MAG: hypothetical protein ACRESA_08930 [Gammaproteobacteria bacterium]
MNLDPGKADDAAEKVALTKLRHDIALLLGRNGKSLKTVLVEIERILSFGVNRIHAHYTEPLPANRLAELRPLADASQKLAESINRYGLAAIPGSGELWVALNKWACAAEIECDRLKRIGKNYRQAVKNGERTPHGGSDGGSRKRNAYMAKICTESVLVDFYREIARVPSNDGESRFVRMLIKNCQHG